MEFVSISLYKHPSSPLFPFPSPQDLSTNSNRFFLIIYHHLIYVFMDIFLGWPWTNQIVSLNICHIVLIFIMIFRSGIPVEKKLQPFKLMGQWLKLHGCWSLNPWAKQTLFLNESWLLANPSVFISLFHHERWKLVLISGLTKPRAMSSPCM